ncbi:MAG TPA: MurT ligase domain-containing protein [Lacisediminihabitans sp.]|uniref:MurT ligase domain-containing protein n=1 Tax=Lacisediminihabitans sp. TaxID=2787631 RepID=UPI002ED80110
MSRAVGWRLVFPILVGKALRALARVRGGGSAFPGWFVLKLAPTFIESVTSQLSHGVVVVLGSNGKSTTTNMLTGIVRAHGLRVFTNPSGANLPQGIASSLLGQVSLTGRLPHDIGVVEVDEAFGVVICQALKPRAAVVLNVQIDQIYRLFEPERVAGMFRAIAGEVGETIVLNREDNFLSTLGDTLEAEGRLAVQWFGTASQVLADAPHGQVLARDYAHEDVARPSREVLAEVTASRGTLAAISWKGRQHELRLSARGLHNAVDAAGAITLAAADLGDDFRIDTALTALESLKTVYGRGEAITVGDRVVEILLMKSLASLQMNLDALEATPDSVLIAFDEHSRDPSWLYAADLSALAHVDYVSGPKAVFIALRLDYAGIPYDHVEPTIEKAVQAMLDGPRPASGRHTMLLDYDQMILARRHLGYRDLEADAA